MYNVYCILYIVFVGDSGVGKTSIVRRLAYVPPREHYKPTIGLDFEKCSSHF